jgi:hypothetical protein
MAMRMILLWFGVMLYVAGVVAVLANIVMSYGDRAQLQVLAAPIWHLAPVMVVIGVAFLILWRRLPPMID